jgi:hypothetical protein
MMLPMNIGVATVANNVADMQHRSADLLLTFHAYLLTPCSIGMLQIDAKTGFDAALFSIHILI